MMATEERTYNGWRNYETWCVNLWMDNDQGSQEYWADLAQEIFDQASGSDLDERKADAASTLADLIEEQHEENMPEAAGVYADMLTTAFNEVCWLEIAEHLIEDVDVTTDEEGDAA